MNWKNVLYLLRVERKSGRLIRGIKATRYRENPFLAYWPYWVAAIIGVVAGLIANFAVSSIYSSQAIPNLPSLEMRSIKRICYITNGYLNRQLRIHSTAANTACRHQGYRASYVLAADNLARTNDGFHPF